MRPSIAEAARSLDRRQRQTTAKTIVQDAHRRRILCPKGTRPPGRASAGTRARGNRPCPETHTSLSAARRHRAAARARGRAGAGHRRRAGQGHARSASRRRQVALRSGRPGLRGLPPAGRRVRATPTATCRCLRASIPLTSAAATPPPGRTRRGARTSAPNSTTRRSDLDRRHVLGRPRHRLGAQPARHAGARTLPQPRRDAEPVEGRGDPRGPQSTVRRPLPPRVRPQQPQQRRRGLRRRGPGDRGLRVIPARQHVQLPLRRLRGRQPVCPQRAGEATASRSSTARGCAISVTRARPTRPSRPASPKARRCSPTTPTTTSASPRTRPSGCRRSAST